MRTGARSDAAENREAARRSMMALSKVATEGGVKLLSSTMRFFRSQPTSARPHVDSRGRQYRSRCAGKRGEIIIV